MYAHTSCWECYWQLNYNAIYAWSKQYTNSFDHYGNNEANLNTWFWPSFHFQKWRQPNLKTQPPGVKNEDSTFRIFVCSGMLVVSSRVSFDSYSHIKVNKNLENHIISWQKHHPLLQKHWNSSSPQLMQHWRTYHNAVCGRPF